MRLASKPTAIQMPSSQRTPIDMKHLVCRILLKRGMANAAFDEPALKSRLGNSHSNVVKNLCLTDLMSDSITQSKTDARGSETFIAPFCV